MSTGGTAVPSNEGLLTTVAYQFGDAPPCYALEGVVAMAGSLVQWLRDGLKLYARSADIEPLAASVPDNGGVYIVPAFSGLFAPHWRSDARGLIAGLTHFVNSGHIARAALEAAAYQTRDVVEAMQRDSGITLQTLRVDDGMTVNDLLLQFQSDLLDVPVVRPSVLETTALGAAYAAGLAVGYWQSTHELVRNWGVAQRWEPNMEPDRRTALITGWNKALEGSFGWTA